MMNFESFAETVCEEIKDFLPEEYQDADVSILRVKKDNDTELTGISIKRENETVTPNIYLERFYERYSDNAEPLNNVLQAIADARVNHNVATAFDASVITNFETAKDRIVCKLINAEMNAAYLEDKPNTRIANDLAVVYAVKISEQDLAGVGIASAPITYGLLQMYGITVEELHEIAMQNIEKQGFSFKSMRDTMLEMMPDMADLIPEDAAPPMYVLTNNEKVNGAAMLLNQRAIEKALETVGEDFIILPSSIHEVLILPASVEQERGDLDAMVQEVNATQVAPDELLSDHIYRYVNGQLVAA